MPTIEQLENSYWGAEPSYDSYLVTTIYQLRQKQLEDFTTEDLRICIGQNQSLPILIPMALQVLRQDLLAEGHYYPGDLLHAVFTSEPDFWQAYPHYKRDFIHIFRKNQQRIKHSPLCTAKGKAALFEQFKLFVAK
jgi:hypothetical protein